MLPGNDGASGPNTADLLQRHHQDLIILKSQNLGRDSVRITFGVNITHGSKSGDRALSFDHQTNDIGHFAVGLDGTCRVHAPVIFGQTEGRCHERLFAFLL
jgi:hypothetical protein